MLTEFLIFATTCVIIFYIWSKNTFTYWDRHNVKSLRPQPVVGNFKELLMVKSSLYEHLATLYNAAADPLSGIYFMHRPALMIRDLDLIKTILIKDFNCFSNRVITANYHDTLGDNNLFFVRNPKWRNLRPQLTPIYTSGKLKQMYPLMVEIAKELEVQLNKISPDSEVDVKDYCIRFTTDLIATTAFGLRANSLRDKRSDFYINNLRLFQKTIKRALDFAFMYLLPSVATLLRVNLFSEEGSKFLRSTIAFVMAERQRSGQQRNDLIDFLIELKNAAALDPQHPANDSDFLVAQAGIFNLAGFETSSSTMSFTLHELAHNLDIQERLRHEILKAFDKADNLTYEQIQELPYLTQVVNETLRKYPVVGFLERQCTPVKGSAGYSLQPYADFEIPATMPIFISVLGIHKDEKYWTQPEKFDPERFAPENRANVNWSAYMPFGNGPHNCIGMRLGLMQSKLGLVHFLRNHRVSPGKDSTYKVLFEPTNPLMTKKGGILLKVERI